MSVLNKKPYIDAVLESLDDVSVLATLMNGGGDRTELLRTMDYPAGNRTNISVSDKGVHLCSLQVGPTLYHGYLIYTDDYCTLLHFTDFNSLSIFDIDVAKKGIATISEYLDINELRRVVYEISDGSAVIEVSASNIKSTGASEGQVLVADGNGGAIWGEAAAGGGNNGYHHKIILEELDTTNNYYFNMNGEGLGTTTPSEYPYLEYQYYMPGKNFKLVSSSAYPISELPLSSDFIGVLEVAPAHTNGTLNKDYFNAGCFDGKSLLFNFVGEAMDGEFAPEIDYATKAALDKKQDKLTAGDNVTIDNNVISASFTFEGLPRFKILQSEFTIDNLKSLVGNVLQGVVEVARTTTDSYSIPFFYLLDRYFLNGTSRYALYLFNFSKDSDIGSSSANPYKNTCNIYYVPATYENQSALVFNVAEKRDFVPNLPSDTTKTYILKYVNGELTWVEEA